MIRIEMIRHGKTEGNIKKWYYGEMDIPITNIGVDEITNLVAEGKYPDSTGKNLYTSGLLRTEQTFFLIYGNAEHKVINAMREYSFGIFEGKAYEDLKDVPEYIEWVEDQVSGGCEYEIPEGESLVGFDNRVNDGFKKLLQMGEDSIVVCHGGVISAIMGRYFSEEKKHIFDWVPDPARGYALIFDGNKPISYEPI